jgi:Bacteriocin-protection, YdeI or OmpD-Associated/Domain of unknown function (DUF1905)
VAKFRAKIIAARGGGAYVLVPDRVIRELGGGGRIPVDAAFEGVQYRGSIVNMGAGPCIGVLKAIRSKLGKEIGDAISVVVTREEGPRTIAVAADLAAALRKAEARAKFDALSFSHQREYVRWIDEAKRADTRARRITKTVEGLA